MPSHRSSSLGSFERAGGSPRLEDGARPQTTLRARRACAEARDFDPTFFRRSPLFWPLVPAAERLAASVAWPDIARYARVFGGAAPVRFVEMVPPPRRRRRRDGTPIDPRALYDARITLEGCVPTRLRSWHDLLNALVWGTFPAAKLALHERQHRALAEHVPAGATRLPGARTRELDALALLDEGGIVVLTTSAAKDSDALTVDLEAGRARGLIFGHALYEGLVLETRAMAARAWTVRVDALPSTGADTVRVAEAALAAALEGEALVPEALPRLPLSVLDARGAA